MAIAGSAFGPYAGDLLVASEISGAIRAISPRGVITRLRTGAAEFVSLPGAETVNVVPASLGSGNPEGFYVVNAPRDILKAAASEFLSLKGDAIVTSEAPGSPIWDLKYDTRTGFFDAGQVGALPNHPEDSIFVTAPSIFETAPKRVSSELVAPEPSTWAMMLIGFVGLGYAGYRASRKSAAAAVG
jgi:hypothetical protein